MTVTELSAAVANEFKHGWERLAKVNTDIGELFGLNVAAVINKINDVIAVMTVEVIASLAKALHSCVVLGGVKVLTRRFETESNRSIFVIESETCMIIKANLGTTGWRRIFLKEKLVEVWNGGYRGFGG